MKSTPQSLRSRVLPAMDRRADLIALVVIFALTVVGGWVLVGGGVVVSKGPITQYYHWYSYLGGDLRSGDIPEWNPGQFSGTPSPDGPTCPPEGSRPVRGRSTAAEYNPAKGVDDLFELARIDAGLLQLTLEEASLHDMISDTISSAVREPSWQRTALGQG